ncbi:MAG: aspartate aminotransferase family protein [Verrucomicrobia bacterium]|nr:aspartate aminotransferase family protein [Verrucomicrobiota bacterium]
MPSTADVREQLARFESRNVTFLDPDGHWPIVWDRARGCSVWTEDGRRYLDLTAAFGVTAAGHANPAVVRAGQLQMGRLLHAMGDVHPHALKGQLAQVLSELTFERWTSDRAPELRQQGKVIFGSSGFEAVEAALKTARLATGRTGVLAFRGGYHGLGYGALNVTQRAHFRDPFRDQLREFGTFLDWPACGSWDCACPNTNCQGLASLEAQLEQHLSRGTIGAILVEPLQARGGIRIPSPDFLPRLRAAATRHGALLILDEIYTGFGRTGRWFATEHVGVVPDLICLGKALTGGFPLSACVGRADLMDAWPPSHGEAIHTSTFLGHPVGCAMALAQIEELQRRRLPERSARLGRLFLQQLAGLPRRIGSLELRSRGLGLMVGLELRQNGQPATEASLAAVKLLLNEGYIVLPEGEFAEVIGFTPPLTITARQLEQTVCAVEAALRTVARPPRRRSSRTLAR